MSDLPSYFELQQMDEIEKLRREVKLMSQLMKEMGDVLNHYLELRPNHDDGAKAFLVLEKYRKFLEGIEKWRKEFIIILKI